MKVESFEEQAPEDIQSIERYLGSGAIKGIGAALAARIVRRFKEDTFRIIEEEPERLAEIKGISERKAMEISSQVEENDLFAKIRNIHQSCSKDLSQIWNRNIFYITGKSISARR